MQYQPKIENQPQGMPTRRPASEAPDIVQAIREHRPPDASTGEYEIKSEIRDEERAVDLPTPASETKPGM
jgi:hypothetical protein